MPSGTEECQAIFHAFVARDFSEALYFRTHRMLVDTYALQHPDTYCISAKSLAAHLAGLCWFMHNEGGRALGPESLHRWLSGRTDLIKPSLPAARGVLTIGDIDPGAEPDEYAAAVERWARSTWAAYQPLHSVAERWLSDAQARR